MTNPATLPPASDTPPEKRRHLDLIDRGLGAFLLVLSSPHLLGQKHEILSSPLAAANNLAGPLAILFCIFLARPIRRATLTLPVWIGLLLSVGASYFTVAPRAMHARFTYWLFTSGGLFYLLLAIAGYISLGRSFGIVPAFRKVVLTGPFQWVRHPIYAAYLHTAAFFTIFYPSWWNGLLYFAYWGGMEVRAREEERLLMEDPAYADLLTRVRRRFFSWYLSWPVILLAFLSLYDHFHWSAWLRR